MTAADRAQSHVLLRSSWQVENIGDVAHSPGALLAWSQAYPDAKLTLWPKRMNERERAMINTVLPAVDIIEGVIDDTGAASTPELQQSWDTADLLVHGSAATVVERPAFHAWRKTGRPYGYFGITLDPIDPLIGGTLDQLREMITHLPTGHLDPELWSLLSGAAFVFCRDTLSLDYLRRQEVDAGRLDFGPDGTFAYTYTDRAAGDRVLARAGLGDQRFTCFVPRLRHVPYHRLRSFAPQQADHLKDAINAAHIETDLRWLADLIAGYIRQTGEWVLLCPEMSHVVELYTERLLPMIAADAAPKVAVVDRYWELQEAAAVYARARAVVSMECHSPILAANQGTPALYLRTPSETVKGQMFEDLELAGTVVEMPLETHQHALDRLLTLIEQDDPRPARTHRLAQGLLADRVRAAATLTGEHRGPR